ncbi:two-component system response regulator NarL [Parendozoicomonas haliclonae]|uniref:Nitrate/nitrite response regulator protein NarL n=1 Tax=Parendozoicomonas haliclonae TaxID=1960125 RepID=A0A1X7AEP3_9GAMM|nr:two-component system response regulator NarL [Parendozoicomonas haliclonae]SMA35151.1 Nitrate/nitrite response regulator protein NarL [Parendozoicomonas haliclonae]
MTASVLLIDDHPLLRKGLRQLISDYPDLEVIGEAGNGKSGLELAESLKPDLILLDLNMKGMDGLDTLRAMRNHGIASRIVMLTVSDHKDDVAALFKAGADGYLLKDMEPDDMIECIRNAASGKIVVDDRLASVLASVLRPEREESSLLDALTSRQHDILMLIADGLSNKMIARELDVTEATVKVHVKHLLKKLNMKSRVEAAVWVVNQNRRISDRVV